MHLLPEGLLEPLVARLRRSAMSTSLSMSSSPRTLVECDALLELLAKERHAAAGVRNDQLCALLTDEINRTLKTRFDLQEAA